MGDIIVFRSPYAAGNAQNLVKRIVGLPGDVIEIRNGELYRKGTSVVGEGYVKRSPLSKISLNMPPVKIPPDHVYVMGDNRDRSSDSRI